jgi:hypothetical protein
MAVPLIDIRTAVLSAITTAKGSNQYTYNDFEIDWAYVPITELKDFPAKGKVWVIGLASDDEDPKTRTGKGCRKEIPIQIAIQRQCDATDKTLQDQMITLEDQIRETIRTLDNYQWLRTEALKDENGLPFQFMGMRQGYFEAYFTAYFLVIRS